MNDLLNDETKVAGCELAEATPLARTSSQADEEGEADEDQQVGADSDRIGEARYRTAC
jgi:hypothetical protein